MTDLTDEQLREMRRLWRHEPSVFDALDELLAHRARVAREAQLEAALREARKRIFDSKHNAMFSSKDMIVKDIAGLLPRIDAALAQPAGSGANKTRQSELDRPSARTTNGDENGDLGQVVAAPSCEQSASKSDEEAAKKVAYLPTVDEHAVWRHTHILSALAQARAEGKAEGMEAAAKIALYWRIHAVNPASIVACEQIAAAIREAKP